MEEENSRVWARCCRACGVYVRVGVWSNALSQRSVWLGKVRDCGAADVHSPTRGCCTASRHYDFGGRLRYISLNAPLIRCIVRKAGRLTITRRFWPFMRYRARVGYRRRNEDVERDKSHETPVATTMVLGEQRGRILTQLNGDHDGHGRTATRRTRRGRRRITAGRKKGKEGKGRRSLAVSG